MTYKTSTAIQAASMAPMMATAIVTSRMAVCRRSHPIPSPSSCRSAASDIAGAWRAGWLTGRNTLGSVSSSSTAIPSAAARGRYPNLAAALATASQPPSLADIFGSSIERLIDLGRLGSQRPGFA
jgi:hypothetical protein